MAADKLDNLVSRLEAVTTRLENVSGGGGGVSTGGSGEGVSASIQAYDDIINTQLAELVALGNKIGGDVTPQMTIFKELFTAQREFLLIASRCKKPADAALQTLIKAQADKLTAVQEYREMRRTSKDFNHLSAVSEAVAGLGWVLIAPAPAPYVKESQDSAIFYTNRILKDFKDKDQTRVDWAKALIKLFAALQTYVKANHTTGVSWNPRGVDVSSVSAPGAAGPPPPGPPPPPMVETGASVKPAADGRSQLFSALNKGADITSGLKKVKDDEKVHKNPALRQGAKSFTPPTPKSTVQAPHTAPPKGQPMCELDRKKWRVEYQHGIRDIVIANTNLQQVVYIYKCEQTTVQVKGKVNSICIDQCKKTAVVFEDVVCAVDIINSASIQAQSMGKMPTLNIDKTDGAQVYLNTLSLNAHIISAKSSEMNILVPKPDGDYEESAIPEQFQTLWNGTKLVTTCVGHSG